MATRQDRDSQHFQSHETAFLRLQPSLPISVTLCDAYSIARIPSAVTVEYRNAYTIVATNRRLLTSWQKMEEFEVSYSLDNVEQFWAVRNQAPIFQGI
jgi:hypothetical protein